MKLRWKLLIVLLSITAIPMLSLNFLTRNSSHELLEEMTSSSREVLIARAKAELLRRMKDHAAIVSKERQIVGLALRAQSGRLRAILEGKEKRIGRVKDIGLQESIKHFREESDGKLHPLMIDKSRVRIDLTRDATVTKQQAETSFKAMIRPFRRLEKTNPELIYWQIVRLTNGIIGTYPYYEADDNQGTHSHWMDPESHKGMPAPMHGMKMDNMPGRFRGPAIKDFPPHQWYEFIQNSPDDIIWTPPYKDPVTGKFIVAAVTKIQEFKGIFHGAMMIMVPLGNVLKGDLDLTGLSQDTASMLVRARPQPSGEIGIQVIAEEHKGESTSSDHGGWMAGPKLKWLTTDDQATVDGIAKALHKGEGGTVNMDYKGKPCLWVYVPIKNAATSLILIVPMENIIRTTIETEQYLTDKIEGQYIAITTFIWTMLALIVLASLLLSKTMTRRISELASAFHRLAQGDFSARVEVKGRDELSNLSHSFNELAPALEEQVRLKEALTVAQEVQRSLLPEAPPQVNGLDVAGMSLYCEDTGGDYFDYPHLGIEADEFGLAVGDVSGHGIPAALLMTTARAFLRQRAQSGGNLGKVVGDANRMLSEDVRLSGRFMTLFLFAIDPESRTARWVRAGHDPAMVYIPSLDTFGELGGDTGLPLGVDGDWAYVEEHTNIEKGTIILIGTDGIWEAANPKGEMYGKQRLNTILQQNHDKSSQEILDIIIESLKEFSGAAGFVDDVTLAVVKVV